MRVGGFVSMVLGGSFAFELLRVGLALLLVSIVAVIGLRMLARRPWLGARAAGTGPELRVLRHVALGPRSSVAVVAVGERVLLLGLGEGGAPQLLLDLGVPAQQNAGALPAEPRDG